MAEIDSGQEIFRPYARLISILGDQLISNKWVGVIELVKNCYDADAENVTVRFCDFNTEMPFIEIEDDGEGMSLDIIKNVWMKPATPNKLNKKKSDRRLTKRGRAMQGDKGVGRFAVYKLGSTINIYTKTINTNEVHLKLDLSQYAQDDEFEEDTSGANNKFLDEIQNEWKVNDIPEEIKNVKKQGTLIRISNLRNSWKEDDLNKLQKAFYRMMPPVLPGLRDIIDKQFIVNIYWNSSIYVDVNLNTFENIVDLSTAYFEGSIDNSGKFTYIYKYAQNEDKIEEIDLFLDVKHDLKKLKLFRKQFYKKDHDDKDYIKYRNPNVGEFYFFIYYFNLTDKSKYSPEEQNYIKDNSVFLYRDNTRVYPYGEGGDDWLKLSQYRAEDKAGNYFSYNDLIGFVFITQKNNGKLRDAADREGLVNIDNSYDDFIALIQAGMKVMKDLVNDDKLKNELKKQKPFLSFQSQFQQSFDEFKNYALKSNNSELIDKSNRLLNSTNNFVSIYRDKVKVTQELAGLGMAVEKSTHDLGVLLKQIKRNAHYFIEKLEKNVLDKNELKNFLGELNDNIELLYQELQVLTPLMRVSRKFDKEISIKDATERVVRYFKREIDESNIEVKVNVKADIFVKTNLGLVLQVLINLMDNAIYWLKSSNKNRISIDIDGLNNRLTFADDGIGIEKEIQELVFLEFYSRKSDGRGLGLYIVRELLERINSDIYLISEDRLKLLPGANFLIEFDNQQLK